MRATSHSSTMCNDYSFMLDSLEKRFGIAMTRAQFRETLNISKRTDCRMYMAKNYPATKTLHGEERIFIPDFIDFIEGLPEGKSLTGRARNKANG